MEKRRRYKVETEKGMNTARKAGHDIDLEIDLDQ